MNKEPVLGIDDKYHYVYEITNLLDGRKYIGKHTAKCYDNKYMGSSKHLKHSINKHGVENFKKNILWFFDTSEDAYVYEKHFITEEIIKSELYYNRQGGGKGFSSDKNNPRSVAKAQGNLWKSYPIHLHTKNQNRLRIENGTHNLLGVKPWNAPSSTFLSKCTWAFSEELLAIFNLRKISGGLYKNFVNTYGFNISETCLKTVSIYFRSGWIPEKDLEWVIFSKQWKFNNPISSLEKYGPLNTSNKGRFTKNIKPWNLLNCKEKSKSVWELADKIKDWRASFPDKGYTILKRWLDSNFDGREFSQDSCYIILQKLKSGWDPITDSEWIKFKIDRGKI